MRLKLNPDVKVKPAQEIMTGFLAAAVVEQDCWKEEVTFVVYEVVRIREITGSSLDLEVEPGFYKTIKKDKEQEFKEKNGLKQMPGKYRSAKSVIMKALKNNVELLDVDGFPRGKTEVEKDIASLLVVKDDPIVAPLSKSSVVLREEDSSYVKAFWCSNELSILWPELTTIEREIIKDKLKGTVI